MNTSNPFVSSFRTKLAQQIAILKRAAAQTDPIQGELFPETFGEAGKDFDQAVVESQGDRFHGRVFSQVVDNCFKQRADPDLPGVALADQ